MRISGLKYAAYKDGISDEMGSFESEGLDYLSESAATASNVFQPEQVGRAELVYALENFIKVSQELDKFKKALFRKRNRHEAGLPFVKMEGWLSIAQLPGVMQNEQLIHGAIGLATESGEMAEVILKLLTQESVEPDKINVLEEVGDCLWYIACLLRWAGFTFLQAMKRNILKLRARHGNAGFSKEGDGNRDLSNERQVLEGDSK